MPVPSDHDIPGQKHEVTPLELFFDLVFVFAVSQLSDHLLTHLSWRGAAETLVLLRAVFAVWYSTSWTATMVRDGEARTRRMMLAVTLLGLFMNASVTRAFTALGWAFVVPFLLVQLGRTVWTVIYSPGPVFREHFLRALLWFIATSPLWVAGAAVGPQARLLWWALATGIDLVGTWLAHPLPGRRLQSENLAFDADHMLERCRLFLLIALGETVFTTGTAISQAPMTLMTLVTGTFALAGTVALWALSFGRANRLILEHVEGTRDPVRASHHAIHALMVMVGGLIAVAVANKEVIAHPQGHTSAALSLLLFGGPILFLAAQGWYLWAVPRVSARVQLAGSAALVLVGCAALMTPPWAALVLAGMSLAILVRIDWQYPTDRDASARPGRGREAAEAGRTQKSENG